MIFNEPPLSQYAKRVNKIEYEIDENGCWNCISHAKDRDGYAKVQRNGKYKRIHRYVVEITRGELLPGEVVMHKCDNPSCINPSHLVVGTQEENQLDKVVKNRHSFGESNGRSKLTEKEVILIRSDARKYQQIADDYGVSYELVGLIKRNKVWKHLKEETA